MSEVSQPSTWKIGRQKDQKLHNDAEVSLGCMRSMVGGREREGKRGEGEGQSETQN